LHLDGNLRFKIEPAQSRNPRPNLLELVPIDDTPAHDKVRGAAEREKEKNEKEKSDQQMNLSHLDLKIRASIA